MKNENALVAEKLDGILLKLEKFLRSNNLKLNIDKTELIRVTSSQQLSANGTESLCLAAKNSKNENIKSAISAKIFRNDISTQSKMEPHFEKGGGFIKMNMLKSKMKDKILGKVGKPSLINVRES